MLKTFFAISAVLAALPFFSTPVLALTGAEAAQKCLTTPGCKLKWLGDGDAWIDGPDGGTIYCPQLSLPCEVWSKTSTPKPKKEYRVPESLTYSGGGSGDTGVPGTGGGGGKNPGSSFPGRGPTTPGVIQ